VADPGGRLLRSRRIEFGIAPYIRFEGQVGEQATMFFRDPAATRSSSSPSPTSARSSRNRVSASGGKRRRAAKSRTAEELAVEIGLPSCTVT